MTDEWHRAMIKPVVEVLYRKAKLGERIDNGPATPVQVAQVGDYVVRHGNVDQVVSADMFPRLYKVIP